ncbi:MAG: ThiF family adenylyltransferase [Planctomycetota bacterium]|nr:ThiF family adenylyltransferase [Planctomycetota bacterium]
MSGPEGDRRKRDRAEIFLVGLGALGGPLALFLLGLGFRRFVLCDPKSHRESNVGTQCERQDVGVRKVRRVARELRAGGASSVVAWPTPVEFVEPGWISEDGVVIVCGDRLSAVRASHDAARAVRRPMFRINIEPVYALATVTTYDYRPREIDSCALCGWSAEDFASQEKVTSCGDITRERPTASSRALSHFAAGFGALLVAETLAADGEPHRSLWNRSFSFSAVAPTFLESTVARNDDCPGGHEACGPVVRLRETPDEISLRGLAERAGSPGSGWFRGSGALCLRARCEGCGRQETGGWWLRRHRPLRRCSCGGRLWALPLFTLETFERADADAVWDVPLSRLGVGRRAAITMVHPERPGTFVLG